MTRGIASNLTGQRFGHLVVVDRAQNDRAGNSRWSCSCDCGSEVVVLGANLKSRQRYCSSSCGLFIQALSRDITGERFGRLVALAPVEVGLRKKPVWRFKCDCGVTKEMVAYRATNGDAKSCGCLGIESRIRHGRSGTREYHRAAHQKWAKENPARVIENAARRQRGLRDRTPTWLTAEHRNRIDNLYREAARLTEATGIRHHVDHVMPLRAKSLSGLHVPWNLEITTAADNLRKGNRVPDDVC